MASRLRTWIVATTVVVLPAVLVTGPPAQGASLDRGQPDAVMTVVPAGTLSVPMGVHQDVRGVDTAGYLTSDGRGQRIALRVAGGDGRVLCGTANESGLARFRFDMIGDFGVDAPGRHVVEVIAGAGCSPGATDALEVVEPPLRLERVPVTRATVEVVSTQHRLGLPLVTQLRGFVGDEGAGQRVEVKFGGGTRDHPDPVVDCVRTDATGSARVTQVQQDDWLRSDRSVLVRSGPDVCGAPAGTVPRQAMALFTTEPLPLAAESATTFTGTSQVGRRLEVVLPRYNHPTHRLRHTYQWMRDGRPISWANEDSYLLTHLDRGRRVSLKVRATRATGESIVTSTRQTKPVRAGQLVLVTAPRIVTGCGVGATRHTSPPSWEWTQHPPRLTYRWTRNGTTIPGATGTTYRTTEKDRGRNLRFVVTATLPGYHVDKAVSRPCVPR